MSVVYRAQCSAWFDTVAPRDAMTINPVFKDNGALTNPGNLATDLANYLDAQIPGNQQITVKLYEINDDPRHPPKAEKTLQVGVAGASTVPRELAICLSYYGPTNVKRKRGRLYIPLEWIATKTTGNRPSATQRPLVAEWGAGFSALGGVDVDWGVWSTVDKGFTKAEHTWVDDEWDTVRSRGLKASTRTTNNISG